ncbi:MAG: site-specific integrase [Desulfobacteraceae bacterium]|nr:site-specific integrase [Desulfobacteraceae bacterium]
MSQNYTLSEMRNIKNLMLGKIRISEQTRKDYLGKFDSVSRYAINDFNRYAMDKNLSKTSYYTYKAAYQYGMVVQLDKLLKAYNDSSKQKDKLSAKECWAAARECCRIIEEMNPDYAIQHIHNPEKHASRFPGRSTGKKIKKTNSKRRSLAGLPIDWQDQIFKNVSAKYKTSVLALTVTGCRPEELRKGIDFFMSEDGLLGVKIDGAKVSETKGQKVRVLYFDPKISVLNQAIKKIVDDHGPITIKLSSNNSDPTKTVNAFTRAVKYAASKAGSKFLKVSPYTFRHQKTSDLKKEGHSEEEVAAFLGHRSTRTQQQYGFVQQGRGASGIKRVEVPNQIRNGVKPSRSKIAFNS